MPLSHSALANSPLWLNCTRSAIEKSSCCMNCACIAESYLIFFKQYTPNPIYLYIQLCNLVTRHGMQDSSK